MLQIGIKKKQGSIVEALKEEILSGNIKCGTEMTQNELASSLGVSRMPVREALVLLEYQGLVERLPNNHVRVTEFGDGYFGEVFRFCAELEEKALMSQPVFHEDAKPSRFRESVLEEMLLHQQISQSLSNVFLRKSLETIIEIYVDFAVRCPMYDSVKGTVLLKAAMQASPEQRNIILGQYFSELEHIILEERRNKC